MPSPPRNRKRLPKRSPRQAPIPVESAPDGLERLPADRGAALTGPDGDSGQPGTGGRSTAPPFLVAAIGASAGGLEAFSKLLAGISADARLAVVLVQHLAPNFPSILPELLDKATKLTVVVAEDHIALAPGHVYVIPPNVRMTVSDGSLHIRPIALGELQGAVDTLFRSVAAEYKERGVGVILSGSAADGSAGIREIKAAGGITLVQDPAEAAVDGMPRAAIATGHVDTVLPVKGLADMLIQLSHSRFFDRQNSTGDPNAVDMAQMSRAFQLLRRASGIDFGKYKPATLKRRLERRMSLRRIGELGEYVTLLSDEPSELERLQEDLLIHVTSFFRHPSSYTALVEVVFPRIFSDLQAGETIRFWVPGCSTGEEVYSLAIVADEYLAQRSLEITLQIFATDVSETVISRARKGLYTTGIEADVSPERLRQFFSRVPDGGYRINGPIRDRCVFARQDITRDSPFSRLDLIVCRNLFIYFNQVTQQNVLGVLHYALRDRGVLMLGPSESIGNHFALFVPLAKAQQIYTKKQVVGVPHTDTSPSPIPVRPAATAKGGGPTREPSTPRIPDASKWDFQSEANRILLNYSPPAVIVDSDTLRVLRARGDTSSYLQLPDGDISTDLLRLIRPALGHALRGLLAEARAKRASVVKKHVRFTADQRSQSVTLHVQPLGRGDSKELLVMFEATGTSPKRTSDGRSPSKTTESLDAMRALEQELSGTREQLQGVVDTLSAANEELQSANEEILSSNEELQSTNEELDTAKEEVQSTNEELVTLNDELRGRNNELSVVVADLSNLLMTVQIPIVIVTRDLRLRQVTSAAEKLLHIIPSDMGRPISHLKLNFLYEELDSLILEVIDMGVVKEQEVRSRDGKTFVVQIRPYQTVDKRIDGAVVVLFDVTVVREQAISLELAKRTGEVLMGQMSTPVLLLDGELKVQAANRPFLEYFAVPSHETIGHYLFDLGNRQWDIPPLRTLLEQVLPQKKDLSNYEVSHTFPTIGPKTVRLDAHTIESSVAKKRVILLAFHDVSGPDDGFT